MNRYYYASNFENFKKDENILQKLAEATPFDLSIEQRNAWQEEIRILKDVLQKYTEGCIAFEYDIPRLGRRADIILLIDGIVFVLEFKIGATSFLSCDKDQVMDYALDLKNFHEASHDRVIVPILVATNADGTQALLEANIYEDGVYSPFLVNSEKIGEAISRVLRVTKDEPRIAISYGEWLNSRYAPTPTIIQAAKHMYAKHNVENITRAAADKTELEDTTKTIMEIISQTREKGEKAIIFVTGVPGAGKTLVGLNVAIQQFENREKEDSLAVYLSGNGPLVDVLTEALARDKKARLEKEGISFGITDARRETKTFIQNIHHYRDDYLAILKRNDAGVLESVNGMLLVDGEKYQKKDRGDFEGVENVAIFDEAQRAWTKEQLSSWLSRKKNIINFPYSEPEFLIWSLNLRKDWAAIVCLVGGGQEINTGEAGIGEWIRAVKNRFTNWRLYISSDLSNEAEEEKELNKDLSDCRDVIRKENLHLAVSMRSFKAENLSHLIQNLLNLNLSAAQKDYLELSEKYPIFITRDINKAKQWLRVYTRGTERCGMICSSQAYRLRPMAIDVRVNPDHVHWFLDEENDIRSSQFLEDACTEFQVQGLELDWSCVVWDADFRYSPNGWQHYEFKSSKWNKIRKDERQDYQTNAYRVLLTRARQGMIICIPEGDPDDETRKPEYYNTTYEYLKSIGFKEV